MKFSGINLGDYTWYNFEDINSKVLAQIHNNLDIPHNILKMALPKKQRPKFIKGKNFIFFILQYPVYNAKTKTIDDEEIDVFIGKDYVISIHESFPSINTLYKRINKHDKTELKKFHNNPAKLIHDFIIDSTDTVWDILDRIYEEINILKKHVFNTSDNQIVLKILHIKTIISSMKKSLQFQKGILKRLKFQSKQFFDKKDNLNKFDRLIDLTTDLWQYLETYHQAINAIEETHKTAVDYKLNTIMSTLTVFSVIFLPLTLLTGILGMRNLPDSFADPTLFYPLMVIISLTMILLTLIFIKKKWL